MHKIKVIDMMHLPRKLITNKYGNEMVLHVFQTQIEQNVIPVWTIANGGEFNDKLNIFSQTLILFSLVKDLAMFIIFWEYIRDLLSYKTFLSTLSSKSNLG